MEERKNARRKQADPWLAFRGHLTGGFDLGFQRANMVCAWQVEIDARCNEVLAYHWPDVSRFGDIRDCGAHNLEPVDIISFGSPCQNFSIAGDRSGLDGEKSSIISEAFRVVRELKPTFAIWENVRGALSSNSGRDFAAILSAFQECGAVDIAYRVLDAQYWGVPQRRRRIFLVADFRKKRAGEILFEPSRSAWDFTPSAEAGARVAAPVKASSPSRRGGGSWPVAEEFVIVFDWQSGGDVRLNISEDHTSALQASQTPAVQNRYGIRRLMPVEYERLMGVPDGHTAINGMSDTARYRMLGNAVCVPVVEWIGKRIVRAIGRNS